MKLTKKYSISSPLSVQMEITNMCNNKCIFCYNPEVNHDPVFMTLENAKHIIDQLSQNKVFEIIFTGGEPLLNTNLVEIASYAKLKDLDISIITNGTLMNKEILNRLYKIGIRGFQVSILGHNADLHDEIASHPGAYHKAMQSLKIGNEMGMTTSVNTTLTKLNYSFIDEIIENVLGTGTTNYSITRYIHNDFSKPDNLSLTIEEFNEVISKLLFWKKKAHISISNCVPLCCIDQKINPIHDVISIISPCDGGKTWIGIDPEGVVLPCPSFRHECDSLHEKSLHEIWSKNKFLNKIKDDGFLNADCSSCYYRLICGGGCKSTSIDINGKMHFNDPYFVKCQEFVYE